MRTESGSAPEGSLPEGSLPKGSLPKRAVNPLSALGLPCGYRRRYERCMNDANMPTDKTLIDKIWDQHAIRQLSDGRTLLHVDRHLMTEPAARPSTACGSATAVSAISTSTLP